MGDYKRDSEQDKSIDCLIHGADGFSDEELLKEFEAVKRMTVPLPIPDPPPDEFEKIWARIQEERAESKDSTESKEPEHPKVIKPRFGWRRLAAIGLIACLVAGSGCMVAMGTKSYFYREKKLGEKNVLVNDANKMNINGEDEAYQLIEKNLEFRPLKLGYIPEKMEFLDMVIEDGYASLRFSYNGEWVYLIESKFDKKVSYDYNSDMKKSCTVHNKWLSQDLDVQTETLESGEIRYETEVIADGICYRFFGVLEETEFIQIVERLTF